MVTMPLHGLLAIGFGVFASVASAQSRDLPLREGDRILVKIWSDTVFADSTRVQAGGTVVLPRVGPVALAGLPASRIADSVSIVYARLFRSLVIEVSPLRKVTVVGEVRTPNVYYVEPTATLRDLVAMAGGVTEIGKAKRLIRIRNSSASEIRDWQTLVGDGAILQSGDVLIAPRESWMRRNAFTVVSGLGVLFSIAVTLAQL